VSARYFVHRLYWRMVFILATYAVRAWLETDASRL
jgi:hypothetical protein